MKDIRVLLIAPGPRHSTYDVYQNYAAALGETDGIELFTFPYHNILDWHKSSQIVLTPDVDDERMDAIALSRASRELLGDLVYYNPDIAFIIAGTAYPIDLYKKIKEVQHNLKDKFALGVYFTESPYLDEIQEKYLPLMDFVFTNELTSVERFDPSGTKYVTYLPHSYNPLVHNTDVTYSDVSKYEREVFFCGTPFYERGELLSGVNWNGIDLALSGLWKDYVSDEHYDALGKYVFLDSTLPNEEVSKYYRHSRCSINIHRTRGDINGDGEEIDNHSIYSTGPRIFEVVASGGFLVTDYRKEIVDIFGDSVLYFENSEELEQRVRQVLNMDDETYNNMKADAQARVQSCTFENRVENIIVPNFKEIVDIKRRL